MIIVKMFWVTVPWRTPMQCNAEIASTTTMEKSVPLVTLIEIKGSVGRKKHIFASEHGKEERHVLVEDHGEESDGSRKRHQKRRPTGKKAHQLAIGFSNIVIVTAGVRQTRGKLGTGERPRERQKPAENPNQKHASRRWQGLGNDPRRNEYSSADHVAGDQHHGVE